VAAGALLAIAKGMPGGYDAAAKGTRGQWIWSTFAGQYGLGAALATEVVLTFIFMTVILVATSKRAVVGFAGIPIGLTLTLVHRVEFQSRMYGEPGAQHAARRCSSAAGRSSSSGSSGWRRSWCGVLAGLVGAWLHRTIARWSEPVPPTLSRTKQRYVGL